MSPEEIQEMQMAEKERMDEWTRERIEKEMKTTLDELPEKYRKDAIELLFEGRAAFGRGQTECHRDATGADRGEEGKGDRG